MIGKQYPGHYRRYDCAGPCACTGECFGVPEEYQWVVDREEQKAKERERYRLQALAHKIIREVNEQHGTRYVNLEVLQEAFRDRLV